MMAQHRKILEKWAAEMNVALELFERLPPSEQLRFENRKPLAARNKRREFDLIYRAAARVQRDQLLYARSDDPEALRGIPAVPGSDGAIPGTRPDVAILLRDAI